MLIVWLPCAAGLWAVRNLSLSEQLFDLLFLLLMLESRPLRELARATRALTDQDTLVVARLQAAPGSDEIPVNSPDGACQGGQ